MAEKIFDMHIHSRGTNPEPDKLIEEMEKAGIYGGCVFSNCPPLIDESGNLVCEGSSFEDRLSEAIAWAKGYEDRIFPVIWIHPYEENIIEKIGVAVRAGIVAFKMICSNYYIYEDKCMEVLREIARHNKPVIFHTGILWDAGVSSNFSRPLNWEPLMVIEGLRFSLGHCSWPWIDECISLYGKFLNSRLTRNTAEMFFDTTPGTPKIYREELLRKLYKTCYDVANNVMFGTDGYANKYSFKWTKDWIDTDREILVSLGLSKENFNKLYYDNLLRFLGKTNVKVEVASPEIDDSHAVDITNPETKVIIKKWYDKLNFDKDFDKEFNKILEKTPVSDYVSIDYYDLDSEDGEKNLLYFLYMCEALNCNYKEMGIGEEILLDTLYDIVIWCRTWSSIKGKLFLGETRWLFNHLSGKLFRLGRLQFCIDKADETVAELGIIEGEPMVSVHIPSVGPLEIDECEKSIAMARDFFEKYFTEFKFNTFSCHSWLLDDTLKEILPQESNIIRFGDMFIKTTQEKSNDVVKYTFGWDKKAYQVKNLPCNSTLTKNVRKHILDGKDFHITMGYIKR